MYSTREKRISKEEIITLLEVRGEKQEELMNDASQIRKYHSKNKVYIRGIIDLSNYCKCNCSFCGNGAYVKDINRYRLEYEEIIKQIDFAKASGLDVIHLASGEDKKFDFDMLLKVIKYIKSKGMYSELALGRLTERQYKDIYDAGAQRYILKFETSDKALFKQMKNCSGTVDDLVNTLKMLKQMGFDIGSGNIIGLPGQSIESIADDILLLRNLNVSMASTSVFMPNKESLLSNAKKGDVNTALNFLSLIRISMPDKNLSIPSNSTFGEEGKIKALKIASNELSLNITPSQFANQYSIYTGKDRVKDGLVTISEKISLADMKQSTLQEMIYE